MSARAPDLHEPVSAKAFAERLTPLLAGAPSLALAVSGGGDSMALMALGAEYARAHPVKIHVLTVDHGLRSESAEEARFVAETAARLGLAHVVLRWEGRKPGSNLQAQARDARYRLMREWRRSEGVGPLAVAHTADDQAETFLLRLARGSGVDGLSAMAAERPDGEPDEPGLRLIRPLLDVSRQALRATCRAYGVGWREDPSNQDARFDRIAARRALEALGPLGLTRERLAKTAGSLRRARGALEAETDALLKAAAEVDRGLGWLALEPSTLAQAPREIGLRALSRALQWTAGAVYPPRLDSLEAVFESLTAVKEGAGRTLHGCVIAPMRRPGDAGRRWSVAREPAAVAAPAALAPGVATVWDGRFRATASAPGLKVGALGEDGATEVARRLEGAALARWRAAPLAARRAAPAIWRSDRDLEGASGVLPSVSGAELGLRPQLVIER